MTLRWSGHRQQADYDRVEVDDGTDHHDSAMSSACKVDVGRTGVLFSVDLAIENVRKILVRRNEHPQVPVSYNGRQEDLTRGFPMLPFDAQKAIQRSVFDDWVADNGEVVEAATTQCESRTQLARTLGMLYRRACLKAFGGREWVYLLIAVGDINKDLLVAAATAAKELTDARKQKLGTAWNDPGDWRPASIDRAAASAAAAGPPVWTPVTHRVSDAKRLREHARNLDKRVVEAPTTMSWRIWNGVKQNADEAWRVAEEASEAAGVEYTARDKTVRCRRPQTDTWVGRTLAYYFESDRTIS